MNPTRPTVDSDPNPSRAAGLVDTHCHLFLQEFAADLDPTLVRARQAGVGTLLVPGIDLPTSRLAVGLASTHPGLFAAVGIHPHSADTWSDSAAAELRELGRSPRVKAIGEIGLDYYRERAPRPAQRRALVAQLSIAAELGLPVIVHNREAIEELLPILIEWSRSLDPALRFRAGVLHAFSAEPEHAQAAVGLGFFIGVAGPLTYPSAHSLRKVVQLSPMERLLLETDAPYLPPQAQRGKRNEPAYLPAIAEALAELRPNEAGKVPENTTRNADRLFGLNHGSRHPHLH